MAYNDPDKKAVLVPIQEGDIGGIKRYAKKY